MRKIQVMAKMNGSKLTAASKRETQMAVGNRSPFYLYLYVNRSLLYEYVVAGSVLYLYHNKMTLKFHQVPFPGPPVLPGRCRRRPRLRRERPRLPGRPRLLGQGDQGEQRGEGPGRQEGRGGKQGGWRGERERGRERERTKSFKDTGRVFSLSL